MSTQIDDLLLSMNDEDVEAFLALLQKEKKSKPKTKKKEKYIQIEYTGKVTFTCRTCNTQFNREFTTNVKDQHLLKAAPTCDYCKDALLGKSKENLIAMILSDRKDFKKIS